MGHFLEEIPAYLAEWLLQQQMFWVASAPLSPDGHVNISPKGIEGTFHIVNSRRVWYEDLSGTGAETVAHIRENGRMTILFHAFEGPARIVRLYGKGFFHEIGSPEYDALVGPNKRLAGSRAVIGLDVHKVGTTCGYAVPYYKFLSHRTQLMTWAARKEANDHEFAESIDHDSSEPRNSSGLDNSVQESTISSNGMKQWWILHNLLSLDGLPAFSVNLGKGFPFNVVAEPNRNAHITQATHSKIFTASKKSVSSPLNGDSQAGSIAFCQQTFAKIFSPFLIRRLHLWTSYRYHDTPPLLLAILPCLITFFIGISIGRTYESSDLSRTSSPLFISHSA